MGHLHIAKKICIALLCSIPLAACNRYLDVTPKGFTLLTTVDNYDQWLNDPAFNVSRVYLMYSNFYDLADKPGIPVPASSLADLAYVWTPQYATTADLWGDHYNLINSYNSVLVGIDAATGGSYLQKESLRGEALLGRANEYLYLVNEYGKSYDSATAAQDPGVQIIISDDVTQEVPPRSTVKEVFDFIIADINAAIPYLPDDNSKNRYRGSKAAAYSLLARVYLYARNYSKARENAELALEKGQHTGMLDYNKITTAAPVPELAIRPDAIYARVGKASFYPTPEFMQGYDIHDARIRLYYLPGSISSQRGVTRYVFGGLSFGSNDNTGTSVQEMKLIIAEAAARSNDLAEALKQLDEVRINRIAAAYYQPYQSGNQEFILQKVLEERRFEFPGNGLRWLDMRRLDAEGRMPAVNRYDAQNNIIATLAPHSPRYTLQIPELVLFYNPGMKQNP